MRQKKAFALAEVLITLTIIGVVSAITIPALVKNYQEQVYLNQFKKIYSELSQAYLLASNDNGTYDQWEDSNTAYNILKQYLKTIKACQNLCTGWEISTLGSTGAGFTNNYHFMLSDGSTLALGYDATQAIHVYVDVNGEKQPNKWGYDFFLLDLTVNNGSSLTTYGYYKNLNVIQNTRFCSTSANATGWYGGNSCSYWILKHWNMDYLHRNISDAEWTH